MLLHAFTSCGVKAGGECCLRAGLPWNSRAIELLLLTLFLMVKPEQTSQT